jgi:hypothetical protein
MLCTEARSWAGGGVMLRLGFVLGVCVAASALALVGERQAAACGGCFHPPRPPTQTASDITDERMLLSVSPQESTLYDQIRYAGTPSSFAWVLPIHGTVDVGLSADVLFDSMDAVTATQIIPPTLNCPSPSGCNSTGGCGGFASKSNPTAAAFSDSAAHSVVVTKQENVGPYATVQLHTTDPSALNTWLTQNGFDIPADATPIIDQYVSEGFDFLAMKLLPNQGVRAMRPVRVTTPGASLSLPLRMAGVGTGVSVGITIWVVSDGRYEPQNFPFYRIDDSALVWDFKTNLSNYTTLRAEHEATLLNKGWEIESSLTVSQQIITNVILSGGQTYVPGYSTSGPPSDPSADYLSVSDPMVGGDGGASQTAEEVRSADLRALFAGMAGPNVRVTRMRSDIAHAQMTVDLHLQASADQSELSNVRTVTKSVNETCPVYNGCTVVGTGTRAQAQASVSGHGCAASWQPNRGSTATFAAIVGTIGLLVARMTRARRRSARPDAGIGRDRA